MKTIIHWFRRDLRVLDNSALSEAARRGERVVPVFILEDAFRTGPDVGSARFEFLLRSLESLRKNLNALGYELIVRRGRSEVEIPRLAREIGAQAVFCNRRYEPYAVQRDNRVFAALNEMGVGFEVFKDAVLWEDREILTQAGNPFTVFTPYSKAWKARTVPAARPKLKRRSAGSPDAMVNQSGIRSDAIPMGPSEYGYELKQNSFEAGEKAAIRSLDEFLESRVFRYHVGRDFPAEQGTSMLSAHLRCGTIGIRTILSKLSAARAKADANGVRGCDIFLNELIWREFYLQVLSNFPHVSKGCFRPEYDRLEWEENDGHFQAWCAGMTGYPIVDAAMRCLNATGWMHNRLRMIVAMFLTKDLLTHWQSGERYFMKQLVDGDMAANNGGWQWSAGTGTDAAPYFRIFNPVSQGMKFDPEGKFVREWVPELGGVADEFIHEPWLTPAGGGGRKYPSRIVLHEEQRSKCLAMFKKVRK